jgi:hypothetical protein
MTLQSMSFIFGALLLAVGILGGGFEVKEIKVSNVSIGVRIVAGIVGLFFVGLGFWQQLSAAIESVPAPGGSSAPVGSSTGPPQSAPGPPPKPAEALVPEQIPFIADRGRINVGELYVPAPDHKALAISYSRIGMITGQADVETAKNGALDNCRKALESAGIHNKCELFDRASGEQQGRSLCKRGRSITDRKELSRGSQIKGAGAFASRWGPLCPRST